MGHPTAQVFQMSQIKYCNYEKSHFYALISIKKTNAKSLYMIPRLDSPTMQSRSHFG